MNAKGKEVDKITMAPLCCTPVEFWPGSGPGKRRGGGTQTSRKFLVLVDYWSPFIDCEKVVSA